MWDFERFVVEQNLDEFEQLFLHNGRKDIEKFLNEKKKRCVLVFPPVNSRRRYLLHQLCKFLFKLDTFSVGEAYYRQLVVCHPKQSNSPRELGKAIMEHSRKGAISKSKRVCRPAAPLYIPPAGRRKNIEPSVTQVNKASENIPVVTQQHIYKEECQQCRQREEKHGDNQMYVQQYRNTNESNDLNNVPDVNVIEMSDNKETISTQVTEITQQLLNTNIPLNNNRLNDIDKNENDQEQAELFRASEEINRKNKRIIKQTFNNSDILIISDDNKEPVESWEELLEEKNVMEIIEKIGNIDICHVEENYENFKIKTSLDGELAHVLEIYNFPKEFQTRDLVSIIDSHISGSYHIKWVDDNHALAVFSSGFAATRMLSLSHPLLKLRPMTEASKQSLTKAIRYPNAMMPTAVRPQTCPQTARRMVTGALGLKLTNTREERAKELKILKEAREKKRLSAKQQDDAWEGKTTSN